MRCRRADRAWPACSPAPRPGSGRHRHLRRQQFISERHVGLVGDVFGKQAIASICTGHNAIGHVRYSTTGGSVVRNVQPLFAELTGGGFAIAHNGNLTNARTLRGDLVREGAIFQSTSDTEAIIHLAAPQPRAEHGREADRCLVHVEGAYSLVALTRKKLIGVRDPYGVRPLVLGRLDAPGYSGSETCALDIIGADFVRDFEPGEMVVDRPRGDRARCSPSRRKPQRFCIFEYVYFARPDSMVEGRNVYEARKHIGAELAHEAPARPTWSFRCPIPACPRRWAFAVPRDSVRARHHPQPLCRPYLHRAVGSHPPSWREAEAQCQPREAPG